MAEFKGYKKGTGFRATKADLEPIKSAAKSQALKIAKTGKKPLVGQEIHRRKFSERMKGTKNLETLRRTKSHDILKNAQ